ncbi:thioredoxin domain-containing protein [Criblamydia sequanensis]|uniref:Conserved putative membrane protein n=1 Tax=Candidatus Criblamydia sequanensis CRIB-18 TaxID=1437425 RepID=A0A090D347_9BACT|nr:thioredoxin domain-containing protein [Criblamydia sequanensis]CDR35185.1 Conserved putative membrane protein [Criblamydia sequanensis CRIB-18]
MQKSSFSLKHKDGFFNAIILIALITGLTLSILSVFEFCHTACATGQKYRLFGFKFEFFGIAFFAAAILFHLLSSVSPIFTVLTSLMLASGIGAEIWFLFLQKVIIGTWCPICVSIAATIFVAALTRMIHFFKSNFYDTTQGEAMKSLSKTFPTVGVLIAGFMFAFLGVDKINPLVAAQASLKDNINLGHATSPVEVYVFTDWFCPACKKIEPLIEQLAPEIKENAKLYFVDAAIHQESLNYTPYNLAFMVNNKEDYFKIRKALDNLAKTTKAPSDADIEKAVSPLGVKLKELNFNDVATGVKLFKRLVKQFDLRSTPAVIIVNIDTKKGKKLFGTTDINRENILEAIDAVK